VRILGNFNCLSPSFVEKIVPLNRDYEISSRVAFQQPIIVEGDMDAPADTSVDSLVGRALSSADDEIIGGKWDFQGGVTFKEVVEGTVRLHDYDLSAIIQEKQAEVQLALEQVNAEKKEFKDRCLAVDRFAKKVNEMPSKLQYFDRLEALRIEQQVI